MHSTTQATRNAPTEAPPANPLVLVRGLKNIDAAPSEYDIHLGAINALETLRFSLTQKMNTCKDPDEARKLGETYRQVDSTVELIAGWL